MRKVCIFFAGGLTVLLLSGIVEANLVSGRCMEAGASELMKGDLEEIFLTSDSFSQDRSILLAKKKKKKKKKKADDDISYGGSGTRIDPNTDDLGEIMVLPLVDRETAQKIIDNRPYETSTDLIKVVGPQKYRIFKHLIEIRGASVEEVEVIEEVEE